MEERSEIEDIKKITRNKKLTVFSKMHGQYIFEQEKIMHTINTLIDNINMEPHIYDKLDVEIKNLSNLHFKMQEIESFMLQLRVNELEKEKTVNNTTGTSSNEEFNSNIISKNDNCT